MNKEMFYRVVIIGLLASNLWLIFQLARPKHPPRVRDIFVRELQLSPTQTDAYDKLILKHRADIRSREAEMLRLRAELYKALTEAKSPAATDSLRGRIGGVQAEIEQVHLLHFQDIRALCDASQQSRFDAFLDRLPNLFEHKPPK